MRPDHQHNPAAGRASAYGLDEIIVDGQDADAVFRVADRITVLRRGRVVGTTTPAETTREELATMMEDRKTMRKDALRTSAAPRSLRAQLDVYLARLDAALLVVPEVEEFAAGLRALFDAVRDLDDVRQSVKDALRRVPRRG